MTREGTLKILQSTSEQWQSLEGREQAEAFAAAEFPTAWDEAVTGNARRDFLKVMGASMGLAGLGACVRQPEEKIVPYVKQPEEMIPGRSRHFATTFTRSGYGFGVLAESHLGRPTHLEGNADHPASMGGTDTSGQASILELWDPERSKTVVRRGKPSSWDLVAKEVFPALAKIDSKGGEGLRILTGAIGSPSLGAQLSELLKRFPKATWHQWEPVHRDEVRKGSMLAFGEEREVRYNFSGAKVVLMLDSDLVSESPGRLAYAKQLFARRGRGGDPNLRIYAAESSPSAAGVVADHRFRAKAAEMGTFLQDIASALGISSVKPGNSPLKEQAKAVAEDLRTAGAAAVITVGSHLPAEVHALALVVNEFLGAIGTTVELTQPVHIKPTDNRASIESLAVDMKAGKVEALIILDGNPVFDAPAHLNFAELYAKKVGLRIHVGRYQNETAEVSHWHLPLSHYLETWGDARAYDGTVSLVQPLIAPIYDTKSAHEILALLYGKTDASGIDLVKEHWASVWDGADTDRKWNLSLHDGVVKETRFAHVPTRTVAGAASVAIPAPKDGLELVLRPCPSVYDGRYANNAWLQETPRPISRIVWDNAIHLSPKTAEKLGVKNDELVRLTVDGKTIEGPIWVLPGTAADSLTVHLGYGRKEGGDVSKGVGFDAYPLLTSTRVMSGASVKSIKRSYQIVSVQDHWTLEGRNHVRHATRDEYSHHPDFAQEPKHHVLPLSMYEEYDYTGRAWGMVIDLASCTGCNACMIACNSENNVPVVGKAQVAKGREMHWLRIDRYYEGEAEEPTYHLQPMTCMHCEKAPCEPVCPANATVHGPEGLNQMVYNRCIGTRYCSNNCPYKVRRFNFHLYADWNSESLKGVRNPNVTVRGRGVMEKCTYCVQRIKQVTIDAKVNDQDRIQDGKIRTACQSACASDCIVFGDINDSESEVAKLKKSPLNYTVLEELNTTPRTSYLAAVSNPNPKVNG